MEHAKLSASNSHRWINCPGSVKAEEGMPDVTSEFAVEGIVAHDIAAAILTNAAQHSYHTNYQHIYDYLDIYVEHIQYLMNTSGLNAKLFVEQRVNFSHIVPEGFGTADAIVISDTALHIIDLKYGQGIRVDTVNNTQLLLYAIGATKLVDDNGLPRFKGNTITIHIVQPRMEHISQWDISINELHHWEGYLKAKAEMALQPDALRIPSEDACRWCKAKPTCPALYGFTINSLIGDTITPEQTKVILDNQKLFTNFINSVEQRAYDDLLSGKEIPGYKLVSGRNIRKIKPESEEKIIELLGEKAYNKSLIGLKELDKLLDEKVVMSLVNVESCKPVLAKENDKRQAINRRDLIFDAVID